MNGDYKCGRKGSERKKMESKNLGEKVCRESKRRLQMSGKRFGAKVKAEFKET